ncbi:MAG: Crp/Fnr family transcriptional regulator [Deltaproteobacteria bacterium]|nr:Crp/Fnr family transcriptional regulator [Deltaproteobacteria bacterium]
MINKKKNPKVDLDSVVDQSDILIEALKPYLQEREYGQGHVLWNEGDTDGRLVVIDKGRVKIMHYLDSGKPILIYVFGPNDVFGFMPFIDGGSYPATAVAMDKVNARVMSRSKLREALAQDSTLALLLLSMLGKRLRQAFKKLDDVSRRDAVSRTAAALVALMPAGMLEKDLPIIEFPEPSYELAEQVGISPETFSRALTRLVESEVLHRVNAHKFQVLNAGLLRQAASGRQAL